jgi:hypothetical protein
MCVYWSRYLYTKPKEAFEILVNNTCQKYSLDKVISDQDLNEIYNCCDLGLTATSGEGWELIPCKSTPDYAELELFFRNIPRIGRIETGRHIQILLDHLSDEFGQILSSLYSSYYSNR